MLLARYEINFQNVYCLKKLEEHLTGAVLKWWYSVRKLLVSMKILCNKTGNVRINVSLRCVRVTTAAVHKQKVLHILSVGL